VGELPGEGPEDAGADHLSVFIAGLGQQQDELGGAAPGCGISPAQAAEDNALKIVHSPVQAVSGQGGVLRAGDGDQGDVERLAAAAGHTGHRVTDDAEKVIFADERAGVGRLLQPLQQGDGGDGPGVAAALGLPVELAKLVGGQHAHPGEQPLLQALIAPGGLPAAVQMEQSLHLPAAQVLPEGLKAEGAAGQLGYLLPPLLLGQLGQDLQQGGEIQLMQPLRCGRGPGVALQRREKAPPVQRQGLQPAGPSAGLAQPEKFLRIQADGKVGIPLVTALTAEEQRPAGALAQLVQTGAGPVDQGLQCVEGGGSGLLPEQAGELLAGNGAFPLPDQVGQQQVELVRTAADGALCPRLADGEFMEHLNLQGGGIHRNTAFL
jgi:hypothetical protein